MQGTVKNISLLRRLIIDLMHASRDVPFVSLTRTLHIRPLIEARAALARRPGYAAVFVKAFAIVARYEPALRTLYAKWPRPCFYELPRNVAMVAIARVEHGEHCVLPQRVCLPDQLALAEVDAAIRYAKEAPFAGVRMCGRILMAGRMPMPMRRNAGGVGGD